MPAPFEPLIPSKRASSHIRLSAATDLYVRYAAAEAVVLRRLRQISATSSALLAAGIQPPCRPEVEPTAVPQIPGQLAEEAARKRARSTEIVAKAVERLKAGKCKSRSPSKAEVVEMSRDKRVDPEGRGVSKNVFRTNPDCLQIFLDACLPFDAAKCRQITTPSWVVRMEREDLIDLVLATESKRDQLTRDLMTANELLIAPQVASIRKDVVRSKAKQMLALA